MRLKLQVQQKDQQGITLLLTLLVLSSILAIAFSLAAVMFVEVRSSGDLLRSETSYYGAAGVAEQAVYNVSREVNSNSASGSQCNQLLLTNCYSTTVGNAVISNTTVSSIADPIQQDSVPLNSGLVPVGTNNIFASNAKYYYLYDPACPAPLNTSNPANAAILAAKPYCATGGSGYSKLTLTYLSSGNSDPIEVYFCEFNPTYSIGTGLSPSYNTVPCTDPSTGAGYWQGIYNGSFSLIPGNSPHCWGATCPGAGNGALNPNDQQELIVFQPNSNATGPVYIQMQTYDNSGNPKGLPYFEKTGVDITAQEGAVNRKVRVIVPNASNSLSTNGGALYLINSGGPSYIDNQGRTWQSDAGCNYGGTSYNNWSTVNSISNTTDQSIYQDSCWSSPGTDMAYTFNVPNGPHTVILKFAETSYASANQRLFNIIVNGVTKFTNYDIFAHAGGEYIAHDESIPVTVVSGTITVQLTHGAADNPQVNGIEID